MTVVRGAGAYVTGAGGGMGLAIAQQLVASGVAVTGVDIQAVPGGWPGGASYLVGDITDDDFVEASVRQTEDLAYVVNAAGITMVESDGQVGGLSWSAWDRTLAVNLRAPARIIKAALPRMVSRGGGAMVHIASMAAVRNMTLPLDAYTASKAGLLALSRSVALYQAPNRIRSNVILPGAILTPMLRLQGTERVDQIAANVPLGRIGSPADIADACLFLLSDQASYITGVAIPVDGGIGVKG